MLRILISMSMIVLAACGGGGSSEYTFDLTNRVAQAYPAKCSNGIVSTELKFSSNGGQFLRGTDSVDENNDGTCTRKANCC